MVVNDGAAYLSVENALAEWKPRSVDGTFRHTRFPGCLMGVACLVTISRGSWLALRSKPSRPPAAMFGRLRGSIMIEGQPRAIDAVARIGFSFTGPEPEPIRHAADAVGVFPRPSSRRARSPATDLR